MKKSLSFFDAREMLLASVGVIKTEKITLTNCGRRILAQELKATENIPPFDRSPYDGYAFRAADTASASKEHPVTLRILEEVPAGAVPTKTVTEGTATKILTGSPIPCGADAVIMYEKTEFTDETVTIFSPVKSGDNIIYFGEDVRKGDILARIGEVIDPGLAGTLAAQGVPEPMVYRVPKVAIISTGSELVEADIEPGPGKIRNTNRYMLEAALKTLGCEPIYLGIAGDSKEDICALIQKGISECDAVVSTGGVSAGDYDLTPEAMVMAGAEILLHGVDLKPGMACCYGLCNGKIICALSGNPASSITNFYAIAVPALKKLAGHREAMPKEIDVTLLDSFNKKSPGTRLLRGKMELTDGRVCMSLPNDQGNVVLSSTIGCNIIAIVPAGSGSVPAGTTLKGFLI